MYMYFQRFDYHITRLHMTNKLCRQ